MAQSGRSRVETATDCLCPGASNRQVNFATTRKATAPLAEIRPGFWKAEPAKRRLGTRCRQRRDSEFVGLRFQGKAELKLKKRTWRARFSAPKSKPPIRHGSDGWRR